MTGKSAFIVFPHQLFEDTEALKMADEVYIIEEYLLFNQLHYKQKLVFHRASMKYYENYLKENKFNVTYIEATDSKNDITELLAYLTCKTSQQSTITMFATTGSKKESSTPANYSTSPRLLWILLYSSILQPI